MANCCSSPPDEVASFLLYVKTLNYQEKPDYQRLRQMLSSGGIARRVDFSLLGGGAGEGTSHVQDDRTSSREVRVLEEEKANDLTPGPLVQHLTSDIFNL